MWKTSKLNLDLQEVGVEKMGNSMFKTNHCALFRAYSGGKNWGEEGRELGVKGGSSSWGQCMKRGRSRGGDRCRTALRSRRKHHEEKKGEEEDLVEGKTMPGDSNDGGQSGSGQGECGGQWSQW